jgi:hypothetical protein
MLAESHDEEQIIARVAALDIGKAELVCCVRLPAQRGPKRLQEVSTHSTMSRPRSVWRTGPLWAWCRGARQVDAVLVGSTRIGFSPRRFR